MPTPTRCSDIALTRPVVALACQCTCAQLYICCWGLLLSSALVADLATTSTLPVLLKEPGCPGWNGCSQSITAAAVLDHSCQVALLLMALVMQLVQYTKAGDGTVDLSIDTSTTGLNDTQKQLQLL